MKWLLVAIIVAATTAGDVLQAMGMRRHGEIHDFRPGRAGTRRWPLLARNRFIIASVVAMAVSFFAFMALLVDRRPEFRGAGHGHHATSGDHPGQVRAERARQLDALGRRFAGGLRRGAAVAVIWLAAARPCAGVPPTTCWRWRRGPCVGGLRWPRDAAGRRRRARRFRSSSRCTGAIRASTRPSARTPRRIIPNSKFSSASAIRDDPALADIERLQRNFRERRIRLIVVLARRRPTARWACWRNWRAQARYPVLLVNDSDIAVEPDYLRAVAAPPGGSRHRAW